MNLDQARRQCTICGSRHEQKINKLLYRRWEGGKITYASIAREYDIHVDRVRRHSRHLQLMIEESAFLCPTCRRRVDKESVNTEFGQCEECYVIDHVAETPWEARVLISPKRSDVFERRNMLEVDRYIKERK